jgi:hypothetical protein
MCKPILNTLVIAIALGATAAACLAGDWVEDFVAGTIGQGVHVRPDYVAVPQAGYIVYSDNTEALPGPNCYWTRMPIYDDDHGVIAWRGQPLAVCLRPKMSADLAGGRD